MICKKKKKKSIVSCIVTAESAWRTRGGVFVHMQESMETGWTACAVLGAYIIILAKTDSEQTMCGKVRKSFWHEQSSICKGVILC